MTTTLAPPPRSRLRLAHATTVAIARGAVPAGSRRRQRLLVCSSADLLAARGVQVQVSAPAVPWPRTAAGRLVVTDATSELEMLALLTAVPGVPVLSPDVAGRGFLRRLLRRAGAVVVDGPAVAAEVVSTAGRLLGSGSTVIVAGRVDDPDQQLRRLVRVAVERGTPICPVVVRGRETAAGTTVGVRLLPALTGGSRRRGPERP